MNTANAILSLTPGTMIQIPGKKQPVRVTEVKMIGETAYAFTTSGRVTPGTYGAEIKGGCLTPCPFDADRFRWQPTMQQKVVTIDSFAVLGLAN